MISCFLLEPTDKVRRSLRRYSPKALGGACPGPYGYHDASAPIDEVGVTWNLHESGAREYRAAGDVGAFERDPRWPTSCTYCGYAFGEADEFQLNQRLVYEVTASVDEARIVVGEEYTLQEAPPGAMWFAWWLEGIASRLWTRGPDDRILVCKTPGGEWTVDSRASNCTRPYDVEHRCWVRHGDPPFVNVDKDGHTCDAGAGSIQCGNYHGFLRNGFLTV